MEPASSGSQLSQSLPGGNIPPVQRSRSKFESFVSRIPLFGKKENTTAAPAAAEERGSQRELKSRSVREKKDRLSRNKADSLWQEDPLPPLPQLPVTPLHVPNVPPSSSDSLSSPQGVQHTSDDHPQSGFILPLNVTTNTKELEECKEALSEIYQISLDFQQSNIGKAANGCLIKDAKGLRVIKKRFTSDEKSQKAAIEYVLKNVHKAISKDCFSIQTRSGIIVKVIDIGKTVVKFGDSEFLLRKYPSLLNLWSESVVLDFFHDSLNEYRIKNSFMKVTQKAREVILKFLSENHLHVVEQIIREHPILEGLRDEQMESIYTRLDMGRIKDKCDRTKLPLILSKDPHCHNGKELVAFSAFMDLCQNVFDDYLKLFDTVMTQDPSKELCVIEYYLKKTQKQDGIQSKIPEFNLTVNDAIRKSVLGLFSSGAYIGCVNKLLETPNAAMGILNKALLPVMKDLALRTLFMLKDKGMESPTYEMMKLWLTALNDTQEDLDKLAGYFSTIVSNIQRETPIVIKP